MPRKDDAGDPKDGDAAGETPQPEGVPEDLPPLQGELELFPPKEGTASAAPPSGRDSDNPAAVDAGEPEPGADRTDGERSGPVKEVPGEPDAEPPAGGAGEGFPAPAEERDPDNWF